MSVVTYTLRDLVAITDDHIGLDDYVIFDESYRKTLNDRIKREYWLEDIAHETPDIFIWRLSLRMDLIMPRYNRMYLAELQNVDPLDGGMHTNETSQQGTSSGHSSGAQNSDGSGGSESKGRTVASDTPQTRLAGNADYASSLSDATSTSSSTNRSNSTNSSDSNNQYKNTQSSVSKGYNSPKFAMIAQYRSSLINVDDLVISELSDLFMGVWANDVPSSNYLIGGSRGLYA